MLGTIILGIGGLIALVGAIWLLVVTFKKSILWGILSLLIPFVSLIFVIMNWELTKKPFLIYLGGIVLVIVGSVLGAASMPALPEG